MAPASPLDQITETTPHRFRIWVSAADVPRATEALSGRLGRELSLSADELGDRGVPLEIASTFSPRTAAILRPLYVLDRAGVAVTGFEALDLVTDISDEALVAAVAAWDENGNQGPHRHRLEVLAGQPLLDRCLEHHDRADARGPNGRPAWRFAAACVACSTAGAEGPMVQAALEAPDEDATSFVGAADILAQIAQLTGSSVSIPDQPLAALIRKRSYVGRPAAWLAARLHSPLSETITDALCDAATRGGESSEPAIHALARAAPTPRVHETLVRILASDEPNAMASALGSLAVHWPDEARPVWRRFLLSRSIPLRWAAEETLGLHGTEDDLPEAAAHLAKLIRTKSATHMTPPRGAQIVTLLLQHRDNHEARAGLDDLSARWDRLADDMRGWLEQHHPELHADRGHAAAPAELEAVEPEEPLVWPPPTIEPDGGAFMLSFDEGAHHSRTRDRFEELAVAAPEIEVLDGDREWLRVRIDSPDPQRLVRELWEDAGPA